MASKRIREDRALTNAELKRRFDDRAASIDAQLDKAISEIDWERRRNAEKDLKTWVRTYCLGLLLDDAPPPKGNQILDRMQTAVTNHGNYMILMGRGQGKSSLVECTSLYCLATGLQKYIVVIANNARSASNMLQDIWRVVTEQGTAFAQDYPRLVVPFQLLNGSIRRRQLYKGVSTDLSRNASQIVFPRILDDDGKDVPTSGSIIAARGISSGLRGMKKGTLRPTCVILDDLQDSETAQNPEQVEKLLNIVKRDVIPLGGKERLSILQTATPICPDDFVEKIRNDKNWITQVFPAVSSFPKNSDLWKSYFKLYDSECVQQKPHDESLEFYRRNRAAMDEGADVFNPGRYSEKDGHISALQKMLEMQHAIGKSAFAAEYQMMPVKYSFSIDITPKIVVSRMNRHRRGELPEGYRFIAASTDLNLSYALTTTVCAFKQDMTAVVLYHVITKCCIDSKLSDAEYNRQVYAALTELGKQLAGLGIKVNGWGIDANGKPFDAVTAFAKNSTGLCGIPACAMIGKASHMFSGYTKSRLTNEVNRTVLCGDANERTRPGSGIKYIFWDSDLYRETVQKAFLAEVGAYGSLSLYSADPEEHAEYAMQFCNEKLKYVKHGQDGRNHYEWSSAEPHDYLDSTAQCFAVAASQNISGLNVLEDAGGQQVVPRRIVTALKRRKSIRFV